MSKAAFFERFELGLDFFEFPFQRFDVCHIFHLPVRDLSLSV
jgi:hypothetical protein